MKGMDKKSVNPMATTETTKTEGVQHSWIRELRVRGGGGSLADIHFRFAPGGNVIVGDNGSGKSSAVEVLRFALGLPVPAKRRDDVGGAVAAALGTGRAEVTVQSAQGDVYELTRAVGEELPTIRSLMTPNTRIEFARDRFHAGFVGASEFDLAKSDAPAQLALVDRLSPGIESVKRSLAAVRGELEINAQKKRTLEQQLEASATACGELEKLRRRLEELKLPAGDPEELAIAKDKKTLREREKHVLEGAQRDIGTIKSGLDAVVARAQADLAATLDPEATKGTNAELLADVAPMLHRIRDVVESAATRVTELTAHARGLFAQKALALADQHREADDAYRAALSKHDQNAARAIERLATEKRINELSRAPDEQARRQKDDAELTNARNELRGQQRALIRERRAKRDAAAESVKRRTNGAVEVTIDHESDRTHFRALVADILKGKKFQADHIAAVVEKLRPDELCAAALNADISRLSGVVSKQVATRLLGELLDSGRVYELETVEFDDTPIISLRHGADYKPLKELSSGQVGTALFTLLMLDIGAPIVIDEPERSLSNKYISLIICPLLAEVQEDRQYIFVSHNANIPILGRTNQLVELDSDGRCTTIKSCGPITRVAEPMEDVLDGGRSAFEARAEFYKKHRDGDE